MASRNFANSRMYSGHVMPVVIDCNFVVDATNGLGITSLKGPYVQNVFMHTTTTPAAGNRNPSTPNVAVVNPNPASGTIVVQLQDSYNKLYTTSSSLVTALGAPLAITAASALLTVGVAYVITILGDATAANWLALGVPAGVTPAVGVSFIARATGAGTGTTARVAPTIASSSVASIELVGNSDLSISPAPSASQGFGSQIILQCRDFAGAIATPTALTKISLMFMLSNSSILIQGE